MLFTSGSTSYSIALNATVKVDAWNRTIRIMLETGGYFDRSGFRYINGRQTEICTIPGKIEYVR